MQGQSDRVGISGEIQLHFNCRSNVSCGVKLNEWGSGQDVEQRRPDHPAHTRHLVFPVGMFWTQR